MDALLASGGVACCERPPTRLILTSRRLPGQYALGEEAAYMSCTYTKISLMQRDVGSLLAFLGCLTSAFALIVRPTDSSASVVLLMGEGGGASFLHQLF